MMADHANKKKLVEQLTRYSATVGDELKTFEPNLVLRIEDSIRRLSNPKRVAIAGVRSSQHAELAEFLVGADLLPKNAPDKACPIIHIRHGFAEKTRAVFGQKVQTFDGRAIDKAIVAPELDRIELELAVPVVADIGFTIMPVYEAGEGCADRFFKLLGEIDVLIWCSSVAEQWQPHENHLWLSAPDELKARSILALTDADRVNTVAMRTALNDKRQLVVDNFHCLSSISIEAAKLAAPMGNLVDPEGFARSGGREVLRNLMAVLSMSDQVLLDEARGLIDELDALPLRLNLLAPTRALLAPSGGTIAPEVSRASTDDEPAVISHESVKRFLDENAKRCLGAIELSASGDFSALFDAMGTLLSGLGEFVRNGMELSDREAISAQLEEARDLIGLLSYEGDAKAARDGADIVRQISVDFWNCLDRSGCRDATTDELVKEAS